MLLRAGDKSKYYPSSSGVCIGWLFLWTDRVIVI